jgi:hypothetical protein
MKKKIIKPAGDTLFVKFHQGATWERATLSDLDSFLDDRSIPYTSEEKEKLPRFGFGRIVGDTKNKHSFPTKFIVVELDTPHPDKANKSDQEVFEKWYGFFSKMYKEIEEDESIPYYLMYLTPSMCGLRFIIKLRHKIYEEQYKWVVERFLQLLEKFGANKEHHDIEVNREWILPTYRNYYSLRKARWSIEPPKLDAENKSKPSDDKSKPEVRPNREVIHQQVLSLIEQIEKHEWDITAPYPDWFRCGCALQSEYGEGGREYFHKISQFHPEYSYDETDELFDRILARNDSGINIGTLFYIALQKKRFDLGDLTNVFSDDDSFVFWEYDERKGIMRINTALFYDFLENEGFAKFYIESDRSGDKPIFIKKDGNQIKQVSKEKIIEHSADYIKNLEIEDEIKQAIRNAFYTGSAKFSDINLATLNRTKHPFLEDTKDTAYLLYGDSFIRVTKGGIKKIKYDELDKCIWETDKINREFIKRDFSDIKDQSDFYKFLYDICDTGDPDFSANRLESLLTIIGYVLHGYKDPTNAKAIILMDSNVSLNPQGGTGKSLLIEALKKIRKSLVIEDGKRLNTKGRFEWVQITRNTKIVAIDDIRQKFKFQDLFSMITNDLIVEQKGIDKFSFPFKKSPKFILSTNYAVDGIGESYYRRVVEFELSDHYNQKNTPRAKYGRTFFEDWDQSQWELFDNLMVYAIQSFLKHGIIPPMAINIKYRKALQATNEDFLDFVSNSIELGKEYSTREMYIKFIKGNQEYEYIKQKSFTGWLTQYCSIYGLQLNRRKSGHKRFFTITNTQGDVKS